jgi:transcriptional regulator with XRE-family HTH domain
MSQASQTNHADASTAASCQSLRLDSDGLPRRLHRIRSVRLIQGVSLRSAARRLQQSVSQTRAEENENGDLPLSALLRWHQALDVPVSELLVEGESSLSQPVMRRANLVKLMKTARAIAEVDGPPRVKRLTERLIDQLTEIMPELKEVTAWPANGPRRRLDDVGRIAENPFPEHLLMDPADV